MTEDVGLVQTTTLIGNLVQTGTGQFTVDVNWTAHTADLVHVNGGTAQLAGTVVVNPMNLPTAGGLNRQFTILHTDAAGDITSHAISRSGRPPWPRTPVP